MVPPAPRESALVRGRVASFAHAFAGIAVLLRTQVNARIHVLAAMAVVFVGAWLKIGVRDWTLLVLAIAMVVVAEGLNTAIEFLADAAVPEHHLLIKHAKDVAAGAVLLASIAAVVIGLLVFVPYLR